MFTMRWKSALYTPDNNKAPHMTEDQKDLMLRIALRILALVSLGITVYMWFKTY